LNIEAIIGQTIEGFNFEFLLFFVKRGIFKIMDFNHFSTLNISFIFENRALVYVVIQLLSLLTIQRLILIDHKLLDQGQMAMNHILNIILQIKAQLTCKVKSYMSHVGPIIRKHIA